MKFNLALGTRDGIHILRGFPGEWERAGSALAGEDVRVLRYHPDPDCCHRLIAGTYGNGLFLSEDDGRSWVHSELPFAYVREIQFDPQDTDTVYAGTEPAELFRSRDGGRSWRALGLRSLPEAEGWSLPYSPRGGALRSVLVPEREAGVIYAGIEQGGIAKSRDDGATWEMLGGGVHKDIHWLDAYQFGPDLIFAATGGGLFRTSDGGLHWQRLLGAYTRAVCLRPREADIVLAGPAEDVGRGGDLLLSRDRGTSWTPIAEGLGRRPMTDMIELLFVAPKLPDAIFAVRSNGELYEADRGFWRWRQVAAGVVEIRSVTIRPAGQ